jgi:hypothetical protein
MMENDTANVVCSKDPRQRHLIGPAAMIEIIGPLGRPAASATAGGGANPEPLQKQLIERLQQAILAGRLPAGSRLPSSRLLATEMGVSRNTVVIAYEHLAAVGYVVADKKGTRVSPLSSPSARGEPRAQPAAPDVAYASRVGQFAATRTHADNTLPLTPGTPALDRFPVTRGGARSNARWSARCPSRSATVRRPASRRCATPSPRTCAWRAACAAKARRW